jgi:hypothetical protein
VLFSAAAVSESGFEQAVAWYSALFGRPPDIPVHDREVMWRVSDGGWLYVLVDPGRAGRCLVTMAVADLDMTLEELASRGITPGPIEVLPGAGRKAPFEDPDGTLVTLIEVETPGS